jgi:murein DD-endopeptidase MepM/ murein hydrolase activator NlpD
VRTAARHSGFGNLIEIDHGDGLLTRYAHAEVLLVKKGDLVSRGQMIARVGSTGLSTGPHLHFEVRQDDKSLDPRAYLTGSPLAPDLIGSESVRLPKGAW